jgi:hypothetical protein
VKRRPTKRERSKSRFVRMPRESAELLAEACQRAIQGTLLAASMARGMSDEMAARLFRVLQDIDWARDAFLNALGRKYEDPRQ